MVYGLFSEQRQNGIKGLFSLFFFDKTSQYVKSFLVGFRLIIPCTVTYEFSSTIRTFLKIIVDKCQRTAFTWSRVLRNRCLETVKRISESEIVIYKLMTYVLLKTAFQATRDNFCLQVSKFSDSAYLADQKSCQWFPQQSLLFWRHRGLS